MASPPHSVPWGPAQQPRANRAALQAGAAVSARSRSDTLRVRMSAGRSHPEAQRQMAGQSGNRRERLAQQKAEQEQARARNRRLLLAGGAIVVVIAVVLGFVLSSGGGGTPSAGRPAAPPARRA